MFSRTRTRFRKMFGVRVAENVPRDVRDTCERYGEQVVGTMLAGGLTPRPADLSRIYESDDYQGHARDWLTETADVREFRDHWVSSRDLLLEVIVIGLICWEVAVGYQQERQQSKAFDDQQRVLSSLVESSSSTAGTLASLKDTTEIMNEAVKRSAKATEESAATAAQTLHVSERAYLSASISLTAPPKVGESLRGVAIVTNSGKGTAVDIVSKFRLGIADKDASLTDLRAAAFDGEVPYTSNSILGMGQQTQLISEYKSPFTQETSDDLLSNRRVLYGFLTVRYKDLFGRIHHTERCTFYEPDLKTMVDCAGLNKAD